MSRALMLGLGRIACVGGRTREEMMDFLAMTAWFSDSAEPRIYSFSWSRMVFAWSGREREILYTPLALFNPPSPASAYLCKPLA